MSKGKKNNNGFTPKELELFIRARRDGKAVSFERGYPAIVDIPLNYQPRYNRPKHGTTECPAAPLNQSTPVEIDPGSLLGPVDDLLNMVANLELFAGHCSDSLSQIERRREDCTHELEPKNGQSEAEMTDNRILAIGKKLQQVGEERRGIKNRFEIIKHIKRAFESKTGLEVLSFLKQLAADVASVKEEQQQRTYTPRTNVLDDLYDTPLPKYIPPARTTEPHLYPEPDAYDLEREGDYVPFENMPIEVLESMISDEDRLELEKLESAENPPPRQRHPADRKNGGKPCTKPSAQSKQYTRLKGVR